MKWKLLSLPIGMKLPPFLMSVYGLMLLGTILLTWRLFKKQISVLGLGLLIMGLFLLLLSFFVETRELQSR